MKITHYIAALVIFSSSRLLATSYYDLFGEPMKTEFTAQGLTFKEAYIALIKHFSDENLVAKGVTPEFIVLPQEDFKERRRGLPFKSEACPFGVALTNLCDAYGFAFRSTGDAIIVFDPVSDVVSNRYFSYLSIPEELLDSLGDLSNETLPGWFAERGVILWDKEKISFLKGYQVLVFEGRLEARRNAEFVMAQAADSKK
jgi:hypothetical protein